MQITNNSDVSLPLAVWLVDDNYDYNDAENYISVTGLMKPLRQIVLPRRNKMLGKPDVSDFVARAMGHSLHDSIEKAWVKNYAKNLAKLGYPESVIDRILINPHDEDLKPDSIPVYLEQRAIRNFKGYNIGGKFDMVAEGVVNDNKSTSAFTWLHGSRDDEHAQQGSLYRWLNPTKITEDYIRINYIFTDWQKFAAKTNPKYPQSRVLHKDIPLWSLEQTEEWISWKLDQINKYTNLPENQIPECTDEELWRSDPKYKYYSDPAKTAGRATKNFDDHAEARQFQAEKGGKGIIKIFPGEPKRCLYCDAFDICTQKDRYFGEDT